jgi:hypothetical protein
MASTPKSTKSMKCPLDDDLDKTVLNQAPSSECEKHRFMSPGKKPAKNCFDDQGYFGHDRSFRSPQTYPEKNHRFDPKFDDDLCLTGLAMPPTTPPMTPRRSRTFTADLRDDRDDSAAPFGFQPAQRPYSGMGGSGGLFGNLDFDQLAFDIVKGVRSPADAPVVSTAIGGGFVTPPPLSPRVTVSMRPRSPCTPRQTDRFDSPITVARHRATGNGRDSPASPPPAPHFKNAPPLLRALHAVSLTEVRTVLAQDPQAAKFPFWDHNVEPPICAAVRLGSEVAIVGLLLHGGADVDAENVNGETPLKILRSLAPVFMSDFPPLAAEAKRRMQNRLAVEDLLLEAGADPAAIGKPPIDNDHMAPWMSSPAPWLVN